MTQEEQVVPVWEEHLRKYTSWIAVIGVSIFTGAFLLGCITVGRKGFWRDVMLHHFATTVGLPTAGIAALCIVLTLRTVAGPIKFKALGFEFSGAAAPIIMWIACFLAIALGITMTWPLLSGPQ